MSFRPPFMLLSLLGLVALAGCSRPDANAFAPACPRPEILSDAGNLTRYRDGPGRDLTDLMLHGRILGIAGQCKPGATAGELATTMQVTIELTRGPAMAGRDAEVATFIAVSDGDRILDKRLFPVRVAFPPNTDTIRLTTNPVAMVLPITPEKSGAAYVISAGFQLTPQELELNRSRR